MSWEMSFKHQLLMKQVNIHHEKITLFFVPKENGPLLS